MVTLFRLSGARDYWFVLTSESVSWFKDDEVKSNLLTYHPRITF